MNKISTDTLMLAIGCIARVIEKITQQLENAKPEQEDEEHLAAQIFDLQRALSELGAVYEKQRGEHPIFPELGKLMQNALPKN